MVGWYLNTCNWASKILKLNISYRLLKRDEILEKKLVRPACGESPVWAPEPEYSREALFRGLVCPVKRIASSAMRIEKSQKSIAKKGNKFATQLHFVHWNCNDDDRALSSDVLQYV